MKKQGYDARLDDHLGAAHGHKSQSMAARRHESEGMERAQGKRKFSGDKQMDKGNRSKSSSSRSTKSGMAGGNTFDQIFSNMKAVNRAGHKSPNQVQG